MKTLITICIVLLFQVNASVALAQGGGAGAGAAYNAYQNQPWAAQSRSAANQSEFITIAGSAVISLKPESLRLVFAVTAEADSSLECTTKVGSSIDKIRADLNQLRIEKRNVVEDFIVVVPSYLWKLEKKDDTQYFREHPTGFRMQTNLHVQCKDESQALEVMESAFKAGVTEIVSFDYWHSGLDQIKKDVLKKALDEAKTKSETLLSVFDEKPQVLNVDNSISVQFPESLYKTITPVPANDQDILPHNWRSFIRIRAHRPLTTFYTGHKDFADSTRLTSPMNPEISISSTVTLTYGSPSWQRRMEVEKLKATTATIDKK